MKSFFCVRLCVIFLTNRYQINIYHVTKRKHMRYVTFSKKTEI